MLLQPPAQDPRPRTLVIHHHAGIGDLIWHLEIFRAIAPGSRDGRITVLATPSTRADEILSVEECVEEVILNTRKQRRVDRLKSQGRLQSFLTNTARLRARRFDRVFIFSKRWQFGLMSVLAGIPQRAGYGYKPLQRIFLNHPPFIERYCGEAPPVLHEANAFAIGHGFFEHPTPPRMRVPVALAQVAAAELAALPRPLIGFSIGSSEPEKQWGMERYGALAREIVARGGSVIALGGPAEAGAARIIESIAQAGGRVQVHAQGSVLRTAALLQQCDGCIGNDTGVLNMAAALARPALCLLGRRPPLDHDPLIRALSDKPLAEITLQDVLAALDAGMLPGVAPGSPASLDPVQPGA